jgi:hypothetical protein
MPALPVFRKGRSYRHDPGFDGEAIGMSSWIAAARWVMEHGYCLVHIPTGNKVTTRKTKLYIDIDEEIQTLQAEGYSDQRIIETLPGAKRVIKTDCVMLDRFTASMLCSVYYALNPVNQKKFDGMKIDRAVTIGWKLCEKCKVTA